MHHIVKKMWYIKHYIYYCIELQVIEAPHGSYIEVQARMILLSLLL
jgi:hypothetical protein